MMQGTDGKYYKVDLKNNFNNDPREVYGVTASQLVFESGAKKRVISGSNRPTSSRTNLRPGSARHF